MSLKEIRQAFFDKCKEYGFRTDIISKDGRVYGHIRDVNIGFDMAEFKRKLKLFMPNIKLAIRSINKSTNAIYGTYYDYYEVSK